MEVSHALQRFLDRSGRVKAWPARPLNQQLVLEYLAASFEPGRDYAEHEVNAILNQLHTFGDHALLRRLLFDRGYLERERSGARYWRPTPAAAGEQSGTKAEVSST